VPDALAVTDGVDTVGYIVEQDGSAFAFDASARVV
jgi:hypothetical protein